jgi:hypothetical protein
MEKPAYLAIASVQVSRTTVTPVGVTTSHSMTQHWRFGIEDPEKMRGVAFEEAQKSKPGFAVDQILVQIVSLRPPSCDPSCGPQQCETCPIAEDYEDPSHVRPWTPSEYALKSDMKITLILAALALAGCSKDPVSTARTNNADVPVSLLFEHNGIKVYRFNDAGRHVYYTDARGATQWSETHTNGKSSYTTHHGVETVR